MKILTIILTALTLCSCKSTDRIPQGTALTVGANPVTGKQPVAVAVGGLTWREGLRRVGLEAVQAAGRALVNAAVTKFIAVDDSGK